MEKKFSVGQAVHYYIGGTRFSGTTFAANASFVMVLNHCRVNVKFTARKNGEFHRAGHKEKDTIVLFAGA